MGPRGSSQANNTSEYSEPAKLTRNRLPNESSKGSQPQDVSSSEEESAQDPGEAFDPSQFNKDLIDGQVASALVNGSVDAKQQEGDGAGKKAATNGESSMSNSATNLTDNKPSLIPSLHFMEPAPTAQ